MLCALTTRDTATAALREARSAALCVRGAPLSGCQLRGVVEALRPGLLAAHPGTWGAAVRRAEEREQRGEPEDARIMVGALPRCQQSQALKGVCCGTGHCKSGLSKTQCARRIPDPMDGRP